MTETEQDPDDPQFGYLLSPAALAISATAGLPKPYVHANHLALLSSELRQLRLRPAGWPRKLLVTMPPRHGKSETASHWFPTWDLALDPSDKIILTSYEAEFAASWGRKVRRSIQEHYPILGARIVEDSRAAHRWETRDGGGMSTAGVGGPITGKGGNVLICDDPIKNSDEAKSKLIRENLWEWWTTTFLTREEPDAIVILIQTRWHEDDLAGRILASPEAKFWRVVNLPALAEDEDPLGRLAGEALWPERYDELWLENKKAVIGTRAFTALYQQRPTPPEGAGILRHWWKWYDEAPPIKEFDRLLQSWDTTFKAVDTADYVAGGVLGLRGDEIYVLDVVHRRMNGPDTLKAIAAVDEQWPDAKWAAIEDTASGAMICDLLERERGHIIRVKPKGSKETRLHWAVNAAGPIIERGKVYLRRNSNWAARLVDEAASFPHGAHDDLVDMLTQGIAHLMPKAWSWQATQKRELGIPRPATYVDMHNMRLHEAVRKRLEPAQEKQDRKRSEYWSGL